MFGAILFEMVSVVWKLELPTTNIIWGIYFIKTLFWIQGTKMYISNKIQRVSCMITIISPEYSEK